jgi:hypothetical protein
MNTLTNNPINDGEMHYKIKANKIIMSLDL